VNTGRRWRPISNAYVAAADEPLLSRDREATRNMRGLKLLDEVGQDVRYAGRSLARNPAFAFVTVLTLAIGVGANTAIFSVIRAVLLAPPLYRSEGLVRLGERPPQSTNQSVAISGPTFGDWAEQNRVFSAIAAVTGGGMTLSGIGPAPIYIEARTVSASYFDVFGLRPLLGRTFAPGEEEPDKRQVVVISHTLWLSQFGSNPDVIGTRVRLDGEPYTVIGVMPPGAAVEVFDPAAWVPRDMSRGGVFAAGGPPQRDVRDLRWVAARLRPGVTVEQARREMDAVGDRLAQAYPDTNKGWGVSVEPWPRPLGRNFAQSLYLLFGAVGLVLAIGCVNIASLSLARTAARAPEVATRTALGAGRGRLIRQFLTEHLVIATIGGACGLMVSVALLHILTAGIPSSGAFGPSLPRRWLTLTERCGSLRSDCRCFAASSQGWVQLLGRLLARWRPRSREELLVSSMAAGREARARASGSSRLLSHSFYSPAPSD
jgi:predicted permease